MVDIVEKTKRSQMMSGIKGKNTKPEIIIRKELFKIGFRYKINDPGLPGKPDLVFPKYKAVIFINGCFWHRHNCHLFKWPSSNVEFWHKKINKTVEKDKENIQRLTLSGWRVLEIWECSIKGKTKLCLNEIIDQTVNWIKTGKVYDVIQGKKEGQ